MPQVHQTLPFAKLAILSTIVLGAIAVFVIYPISRRIAEQRTPAGVATPATEEPFGPLPSFAFVSHTGEGVSEKSVDGRVAVIGFFFTSCQGICPALTGAMKRLDREFSGSDRVVLLQISVDPNTDTVERLAEFATQTGSDGTRWLFLRGESGEAARFAREGLSLGATEVTGDILHSDRFVLVDPTGQIRGYYRPLEEEDLDRLIEDMRSMLAGARPK